MKLARLLDANINRLKEGVRVIEDLARYILNNENLSKRLKILRHQALLNNYSLCLEARDVNNDPLKTTMTIELERENVQSMLVSNFKRAQESARVLEECLKLEEIKSYGNSETFKQIRYELYILEKEVFLALIENK
ncbi:thiamine-phosphate pyrophosphorylase [Helicobacter cetorum]|uniref:thiamine-phosphate pyrophosphorylase n=1 Tax=Helicobacter cetorum TaxID=138563 RepID=UPI000CF0F868|nr:thiamine-phosphate pyrophosphorylase [Helicobacter cetorum]